MSHTYIHLIYVQLKYIFNHKKNLSLPSSFASPKIQILWEQEFSSTESLVPTTVKMLKTQKKYLKVITKGIQLIQ